MSKMTDANWREALKNITVKNDIVSNNIKTELPVPNSYSAIPAKQGRGTDAATKAAGSGGGIASPLTEQNSRTYYSAHQALTSDGLFVIQFSNVHELNMLDANASAVKLILIDG